MKIKLVRPNLAEMRSSDAMAPLSLGMLAALTPPAMDRRTHCRSPRNLGTFLLGNTIMRREIHRKNGLVLGGHGGDA
jgi:hypothetical protein